MASLLRPPHKQTSSSRSPPPPTSFKQDNNVSTSYSSTASPSSSSTVGVGRRVRDHLTIQDERERTANRGSRVEMDFEEALASPNTFKLHEGRDITSLGRERELDSPTTSRDTHELLESLTPARPRAASVAAIPSTSMTPASPVTPTSRPDGPTIPLAVERDSQRPSTANSATGSSRKLRKVHHSTSPSRSPPSHSHMMGGNPLSHLLHRSPTNSPRPSVSEYSSTTGSPAPSNQELPPADDHHGHGPSSYSTIRPQSSGGGPGRNARGERSEEVKKRSMFRSAATASSPDLGTVIRKKKSGIPKVPPLPNGFHPDDDDQIYPSTDNQPSNLANWTSTLGGRSRASSRGDEKSSKTLRAKTGNFLSKVFSSAGTVRERSKSTASGVDNNVLNTPQKMNFGHTFDSPPVPAIPQEFRSDRAPEAFNQGQAATPTRSGKRASKPLPPIIYSPASERSHGEMLVSPIGSSEGSKEHAGTPSKLPIERIQSGGSTGSGRRRRSMSVGDAEQWHKVLGAPSPSKSSASPSKPSASQQPERLEVSSPSRPTGQRSISSTSNASSNTTATPTKAVSPALASPKEKQSPTSKEWENALMGWDSQRLASLEIKDPSTTIKPAGRPRSRTQDPMPIPPRLSLGLKDGPGSPIRAGSLGSPPAGFNLGGGSSPSIYSTPPTGLTPTSPSFSGSGRDSKRNSDLTIQRHRRDSDRGAAPTTPVRQNSGHSSKRNSEMVVRHNSDTVPSKKRASDTIPYSGPVIIGTTPASIGNTVTTVKIDRSGSPAFTSSPTTPTPSSPSTSPNVGSIVAGQRRSSSSNRSNSPQLSPQAGVSPRVAAGSLRVSSLRGASRPTLITNTSTSSSSSLRPPDSSGSPQISVSLTSPSQENLKHHAHSLGHGQGLFNRGLGGIKYNNKNNPASASEPALVFPAGYGGVGGDEVIRTIRLITSRGGLKGDGSGGGETTLSSPSNSMRHAFSNASMGTSVGRSSVSRDGSGLQLPTSASGGGPSSKEVGSGVGLSQEELDIKAENVAQRIWDEDESFRSREKFSEWLGGIDPLNTAARRFYMDHFDFTNMRVDNAFRRLCAKLYLRGESQVIDRILVDFSRRFWDQNPNNVLGSASNIHGVVYSILLLNTDLHVADLTYHMTRQQFVNNTMSTLVAPSRTSSSAPTPARSSSPVQSLRQDTTELSRKSSMDPLNSTGTSTSLEKSGPPISIQNPTLRIKRSGSVTSWKGSLTREASKDTTGMSLNASGTITENSSLNGSTVSVHEPMGRKHSSGNGSVSSLPIAGQKAWEADVENHLKDIYVAVRNNQILQPSGVVGTTLARRGSRRANNSTFKRGSILGALVPSQQAFNGSSSSLDGRMSPAPSFSTSLNDNNTASSSTLFTPPALGFVSNLAHTIIGESQEDDTKSMHSDESASTDVTIGDEELALLGAPWAKEGMLTRKQQWESTGKRAKSKNWLDIFVVIQKGQLSMFTFGSAHGSGPAKAKPAVASGGVVGGGNWLSNATCLGEHMLAHSLSHVLPPPGLPQRPHCFVLTLSNGVGYFFQTGTEELANEWVSTCNYWAARQSKEPLSGGVSNMEYGWSRVEPEALADGQPDFDRPDDFPPRAMSSMDHNSDNFSMRSGRTRMGPFSTHKSSAYNDRVYINDWRAPGHSTIPSTHDEETQLEALQRQAETLKSDLKKHNDLREPMIGLYAPRSSNLAKAMINWESRSQYLLTEIVKYEKYIESLKGAMKERLRRRGEKALEKALQSSSQANLGNNSRGFGFGEEETIHEGQETETEPATPAAKQVQFKSKPVQNLQHKRDAADGSG